MIRSVLRFFSGFVELFRKLKVPQTEFKLDQKKYTHNDDKCRGLGAQLQRAAHTPSVLQAHHRVERVCHEPGELY
jgi:hypothetical protein